VDALVFLGREHMGADRQIVVVAVDKFEGQHQKSALSKRAPWRKEQHHTL
jgi:hypothetical protein